MAGRNGHATTRSPGYSLGPGADLPVARIVALVLILLPVGAWFLISNILATPTPAPTADGQSTFDPTSLLVDTDSNFLPTPVAVLPAETNAGPPAPAADENAPADTPDEEVKIANTGGVGAILRADPPKGRQVAALRDGTQLEVLEHQTLADGSEWLRVSTPDGTQGWVFSRLVAPAN